MDTPVSELFVVRSCNSMTYFHNNNLLPEAICCCLQTCNTVASEVMVADTCVPSLIVFGNTVKQVETNVSAITICCLRLFVVVYKHVIL